MVDRVLVRSITETDAERSGFSSRAELVAYLASAREQPLTEDTEVYRIELHHGGDGDRVEIALDDELSAGELEAIASKLARLDARGPWTQETLAIIDKHPREAASRLAARLGRETQPFKVDVRKLKKLGLTQSFEVGYEISPRGRAYLTARRRKRK